MCGKGTLAEIPSGATKDAEVHPAEVDLSLSHVAVISGQSQPTPKALARLLDIRMLNRRTEAEIKTATVLLETLLELRELWEQCGSAVTPLALSCELHIMMSAESRKNLASDVVKRIQ